MGRLEHPPPETRVALGLAQQGFEGLLNARLLMADQAQVAAGGDESRGRLIDRRRLEHPAHLEIVGHDQSAVADLLSQNIGDPIF